MILFSNACLSFCVCLFLIDYLEHCMIMHKFDRYINDENSCRRGLNSIEHEWQSQYHYKRRTNIVISDMDANNTCDRPLVKLLKVYCFEWSCQSEMFGKIQVNFRQIICS